jgi:hypothetical protein
VATKNRLRSEARRTGLVRWLHYAEWFAQGLKLSRDDEGGAYAREVRGQLSTYDAPQKEMLVTFCTDLVDDAMVARVAAGEGLWSAAEVWRAVGKRSEQRGMPDEAEQAYQCALDTARAQGAKAWEQRAALSLARLRWRQGQPRQALRLLDETFERAGAAANGNPAIAQAVALRNEIAARPAVVKASAKASRNPRVERS